MTRTLYCLRALYTFSNFGLWLGRWRGWQQPPPRNDSCRGRQQWRIPYCCCVTCIGRSESHLRKRWTAAQGWRAAIYFYHVHKAGSTMICKYPCILEYKHAHSEGEVGIHPDILYVTNLRDPIEWLVSHRPFKSWNFTGDLRDWTFLIVVVHLSREGMHGRWLVHRVQPGVGLPALVEYGAGVIEVWGSGIRPHRGGILWGHGGGSTSQDPCSVATRHGRQIGGCCWGCPSSRRSGLRGWMRWTIGCSGF